MAQVKMILSQGHNTLALGYGLLVLSTVLSMSIFMFSLSDVWDEDDEEGGKSHDDPEDVALQKLVFCPIFLIVSSLVLAGMVWKLLLKNNPSFVGIYKIGLLGGSTLLYGSMSFISFIYFCNFQVSPLNFNYISSATQPSTSKFPNKILDLEILQRL